MGYKEYYASLGTREEQAQQQHQKQQKNAQKAREAKALRDRPVFPAHWGPRPEYETMDIVSLPGGYGSGSSTMAGWIRGKLAEDKAAGIGVTYEDPRWLFGWESPDFTGDINADYASLTDDQRDEYGNWKGSDAYKPGWGYFIGHLREQHMREQGWKDPNRVPNPQFRAPKRWAPPTPGTPYNPGQVPQMQVKQPSQMHQYRQQWKSPAPYNPTQAKRPSSNWY